MEKLSCVEMLNINGGRSHWERGWEAVGRGARRASCKAKSVAESTGEVIARSPVTPR